MKQAAGLLLYKLDDEQLKLLLVHPGGPFYEKKDNGVWSIPKGEFEGDEEPLTAARREFEEELGQPVPEISQLIELGDAKQSGGKINFIWAGQSDLDVTVTASNSFEMEWPPKSGKTQSFVEVDRADWFSASTARVKLRPAQVIFIDRLERKLGFPPSQPDDDSSQTKLL